MKTKTIAAWNAVQSMRATPAPAPPALAGPTVASALTGIQQTLQEIAKQKEEKGIFKEALFSGLKTLAILLAGLAFLFVVAFLTKQKILIEPFSVPKELEARGYTSQAVTARIVDQIEVVERKAKSDLEVVKFATSPSEILPDVELPETHTQLKSVIPYLQELMGRKPLKVSGGFTQSGQGLLLTVRVTGTSYDDTVATFGTSMDYPEGVFDAAAKQILRITDPYTLAASRFGEANYEDAKTLLYRALDNANKSKRSRTLNLLALIAERQGDDPTAEARYRESRAADKSYTWGRINFVYFLIQKKRYSEAESEISDIVRGERPFYRFWGTPASAVDALVAKAQLHKTKNELDAALEQLAEAEKLYSWDADTFLLRGDVFMQQCKFDEAYKQYEKAWRLNEDSAHTGFAYYYQNLGDYSGAEREYRTALQNDPGVPNVHAALGWVLAMQGRFPEAMNEHANQLNPNSPVALEYRAWSLEQMDQFDGAESALRQAYQIDSSNADIIVEWGTALTSLKRYEDAKQKYDEALHITSNLASALAGEGDVINVRGDYRGGISFYEKALRECPMQLSALTGIANSHRWLGEYDEARRRYDETKSKYQLAPEGYVGSGWLYYDEGDYDAAISEADVGISIDLRSSDAAVLKGVALAQKHAYAQAIREFQRAIDAHPRNPDPWEDWGFLLRKQKNYSGAEAKFRKAMELDPTSSAIPLDLGDLFFEKGNYKEAEKRFRSALAVAPFDPEIQAKLAVALAQLNRIPEAVALMEQAKTVAPRLPVVILKWGQLLEAQGNLDGARKKYEAASLTYPKSETGQLAAAALKKLHSHAAKETGDKRKQMKKPA
ncbi:MAG TPA: tetratricopeptide repeat protein [Candidatus Dormibacteraeota bacterium]|nr:tetratricopeptide repeat protein [Candidatus Dormibacteraeota bacterium]